MICKICGSDNLIIKHNRVRDGAKIVDSNVWECVDCKIVFLEVNANQQQLYNYYKEDSYRNNYFPDIKDRDSKEAWKYYSLKQPLQEKRFNILKDVFDRDMEVLDIGCATAGFLNILKDHVRRAKGIELYVPYVEFARERLGLDVEMKNIEDIKGETFDIICIFHVLEHVAEPVNFLSQIYGRLKDKGLLIVEVPNISDALISIYDLAPYKDFYFTKSHLFYFCEESMVYLLRKARFNNIELRSYQHYGLINHLCWSLTGETCTATKVGGGGIGFPKNTWVLPSWKRLCHFLRI